MDELLKELELILTDFLESGLESVHEETLRQAKELSEALESQGLHQGARDLEEIYKLLNKNRHAIRPDWEPLLDRISHLDQYLGLCRERFTYDKALEIMKERK